MTIQQAVLRRLLELCRERGLSVNGLGVRSGVAQSTLNNLVGGRNHSVTVSTLQKLCDGLETTLQEFFDAAYFQDIEQEVK